MGHAGWTVVLDERPILVSNWHVLCPTDDTPIGSFVEVYNSNNQWEVVAKLADRIEPKLGLFNKWDFAYAELLRNNIQAYMRPCQDGTQHSNPRSLSTVIDDQYNAYIKVGARSICTSGKLTATGAQRAVRFHRDGQVRAFHEQLIFERMTQSGDSGSIVVREHDNSVTGLAFAGTPDDHVGDPQYLQETIANPLYQIGWEYVGTRWINEVEVPAFRTAKSQGGGDTIIAATGAIGLVALDLDTSTLQEIFGGQGVSVQFFPQGQGRFDVVRARKDGWAQVKVETSRNEFNFPRYIEAWMYLPNPHFYLVGGRS